MWGGELLKVMVVDDDMTARKIIGLYVRENGYEPVFAKNGVDAIEKLASNEVALIVSDLNMPYMDGIELARHLKNDRAFQALPILMLTTENDDKERKQAVAAGVDAYMAKPVTAEAVGAVINELLQHRRNI
ncbi:MAG: response regulator [Candidatus Magnetominusculus sp. LBB02]|nr:response regulator [Candidatus Magnetominusculus sp. LBB02]